MKGIAQNIPQNNLKGAACSKIRINPFLLH